MTAALLIMLIAVCLWLLAWGFAATALSLAGAYFYYRVGLLEEQVTAAVGGAWTGPITIYVFLASMLTVGLVLALQAFMTRPGLWSGLVIVFDVMFYLDRIVLKGRRAAAAELLVIVCLALWFHRRLIPSRWAMALVLLAGALWVNSAGDYRATMMGPRAEGLSGIADIDFIGNFERRLSQGGYELTNALYNIESTARRGWYDFGLYHWNGFVHAYIPGQIISFDLKRSLMLDIGGAAYREFYHVPHTGTTHTGMSDAFRSFWYFGAIKFFIIAFVMGKLYRAGLGGHFVAQALLMLVYASALQSITHDTNQFFMAWPALIVFLGPALLFARRIAPRRAALPPIGSAAGYLRNR